VRLGCFGCTAVLGLGVALAAGALGAGWVIARSLDDPQVSAPATRPEDGARVQQKLFEILRRGRAREAAEPIVLSEGEVNALVTRHLAENTLAFRTPFVRLLGDDVIEFTGQLPLARLLDEPLLAAVAEMMPERWRRRPVWVRARARVRLEVDGRRYLRADVETFALGRQWMPVALARLLLDPASLTLLRTRLPDAVGAVTVAHGRVVIRPGSAR